MPNAFARAMLDQLREPEREVHFWMRRTGWLSWMKFPFRCRDFIDLRAEEQDLLRTILAPRERPRVLDVGCGIGRHFAFIRQHHPAAELTGAEINSLLRDHCRCTFPGGRFVPTLDDVPAGEKFDLILMMGNGLGVFGDQQATRQALERLFGLLSDGGLLLAEAGNRYSRRFKEVRLVIEYENDSDGPFSWGYASQQWLQPTLEAIGYRIRSVTPSTAGAEFFLCLAERPRLAATPSPSSRRSSHRGWG